METIILLHGLYMNGSELNVLRQRLRHGHGFRTRVFKCRSVGSGLVYKQYKAPFRWPVPAPHRRRYLRAALAAAH